MKKKITALALAGSIAATTFIANINFTLAQDLKKELPKDNPQMKEIKADVMKKEGLNLVKNGKILEITKNEGFYSLRVKTKSDEIIFHVEDSVFLFDKASNMQIKLEKLKKNDEIAVIFGKEAPMTASLPAQISQVKAIIVKEDGEDLMISMIDENLKEVNNEFVITKNDKMNVFHIQEPSKALTQDALKGAEAIILYKMATFSLPPQVKVDAAIILNTMEDLKQEEMMQKEQLIPVVTDPKYVPLRKHAEEKGYSVKWQGVDKPIILEKNDIVVEITLNTKAFKYSHMTRDLQPLDQVKELDLTPVLENSTTMVSENFINMLK